MDRQKRFQEGIERYRNAIADYPEDAIPFRIEQKRGDSPRVLRVFSPEGGKSLPVCVSHRNQAPAPTPSSVRDAPASVFSPIGNEKTQELSPVFLKSHNHLHWLAHLQAATPCEPLRRKPRAIAISPAPNGWCYTAGIRHLLEPSRVSQGSESNRPTACADWLTGR